jgi:hypothetical protein
MATVGNFKFLTEEAVAELMVTRYWETRTL